MKANGYILSKITNILGLIFINILFLVSNEKSSVIKIITIIADVSLVGLFIFSIKSISSKNSKSDKKVMLSDIIKNIYYQIPLINKLIDNTIVKSEEATLTLIDKIDATYDDNTNLSNKAINLKYEEKKDRIIKASADSIEKDKKMIENLVKLREKDLKEISSMSLLLNKKGKNLRFEEDLLQANKETVERVKKVQSIIEKLSETTIESEKIISQISESLKNENSLFSELSKVTKNINNNMENAMGALQFQDIIRQQLEHVIYFLVELFKLIETNRENFEKIGITFTENDDEFLKEIKAKLRKKAKTADEKITLK